MPRKTAKKKPGKKAGRKHRAGDKPASQGCSSVVESDTVTLARRSVIKDIVGLKRSLTAAREQNSEVIVDAGNVESIDTAVLQLLAAFALSVRQRSGTVVWRKPSAMFCEMLNLADLGRHLGIDSGIDPAVNDVAGGDDDENNPLCPVF